MKSHSNASVVRETKEGGRLCEGSPVLDQIAAEAALEIETNWKTATLSSTKAIIKSAIEKADIEGYWRGRGDAEKFRAEPPATAGEQWPRPENWHGGGEKWTDGYLISLGVDGEKTRKRIADARNAALQPQGAVGLEQFDLLRIELSKVREDTKRLQQTIKKLCVEIRKNCPDGMLVKGWIDDAEVEADAAMRKET